jgi:YHS domain-containing protein
LSEGGGYKVHGDGRIFRNFHTEEIVSRERRTGSVTWGKVENGKVIAVRKETNSPTGGIMTTDPVCGMRVDERESEFRTQFAGKKYFFCSEECRKEFEDRPEEYLEVAA